LDLEVPRTVAKTGRRWRAAPPGPNSAGTPREWHQGRPRLNLVLGVGDHVWRRLDDVSTEGTRLASVRNSDRHDSRLRRRIELENRIAPVFLRPLSATSRIIVSSRSRSHCAWKPPPSQGAGRLRSLWKRRRTTPGSFHGASMDVRPYTARAQRGACRCAAVQFHGLETGAVPVDPSPALQHLRHPATQGARPAQHVIPDRHPLWVLLILQSGRARFT
jgi:hypothetical protein